LDIYKKHLKSMRHEASEPDRLRAEVLEFLKKMGRSLSLEELDQLKESMMKKYQLKE